MKYKIFILFLIVGFVKINSVRAFDRSNTINKKTIFSDVYQTQVFVCNGEYSIAYHSRINCSGLNNCRSTISSVSESYAQIAIKRRACCICWKTNNGCITDEDDRIVMLLKIPPPVFDQYIQQSPTQAMREVGIFLQKKYDTRRDWIQNRITGLVNLINTLYSAERINCSKCNFTSLRANKINDISDYAKNIAGVDFANDQGFYSIKNKFNSLEEDIYSGYNYLLHN